MKRKPLRFILLISVAFVVLMLGLFYLITNDPDRIIKSKFGDLLPSSAKIEEFSYNRWRDYFEAKISFEQNELDSLLNNLQNELSMGMFDDYRFLTYNFKPHWWDLDETCIVTAFEGLECGPKNIFGSYILSVPKSAVIVKQNDDYYLYLDFVIVPRHVLFS